MKIYLDTCCLNRPFDDQSNARIHLESEAIKIIIDKCENGDLDLISSEVKEFEVAKISDENKKFKIIEILTLSKETILLDEHYIIKAKEFENQGFGAFDSLHLAICEQNAEVLLTVDDKLLSKINKIPDYKIKVMNPVSEVD